MLKQEERAAEGDGDALAKVRMSSVAMAPMWWLWPKALTLRQSMARLGRQGRGIHGATMFVVNWIEVQQR
jgi:hypothetical protein